jgi:hypothetical protein
LVKYPNGIEAKKLKNIINKNAKNAKTLLEVGGCISFADFRFSRQFLEPTHREKLGVTL